MLFEYQKDEVGSLTPRKRHLMKIHSSTFVHVHGHRVFCAYHGTMARLEGENRRGGEGTSGATQYRAVSIGLILPGTKLVFELLPWVSK